MNSTVPNTSRLGLHPRTGYPSLHSFGELGDYLRTELADEDSRLLSESMGEVALHAEAVVAALRLDRHRDAVAPLMMDMLTVLRDHRSLVVNLSPAWRGLYEYAAYLQALNNFRVLIGQWLLHASPWDDELIVTAEEFALVAWRTMGEGMLLVDMYEQLLGRDADESNLGALEEPQLERVRQWWQRLRR
jgi:hypothetical protein